MDNSRPISRADAIFFERAAIKAFSNPAMTIEQAMQAVLDDDRRIFSAVMNDGRIRNAVESELCAAVYARCNGGSQIAKARGEQ